MSLVKIIMQTIWNSVSSPEARPPKWHHLHTSLCNGHSGYDHPGGLGGRGGGLESWTEASGPGNWGWAPTPYWAVACIPQHLWKDEVTESVLQISAERLECYQPGESHGQRSQLSYSLWGRKESMIEHTHTLLLEFSWESSWRGS